MKEHEINSPVVILQIEDLDQESRCGVKVRWGQVCLRAVLMAG